MHREVTNGGDAAVAVAAAVSGVDPWGEVVRSAEVMVAEGSLAAAGAARVATGVEEAAAEMADPAASESIRRLSSHI